MRLRRQLAGGSQVLNNLTQVGIDALVDLVAQVPVSYTHLVDFCAAKCAAVLDHAGAVAGAAVVADTTETPLSLMHDAMTLVLSLIHI